MSARKTHKKGLVKAMKNLSLDLIEAVEKTIAEEINNDKSNLAKLRGTPHIAYLITVLSTNEIR